MIGSSRTGFYTNRLDSSEYDPFGMVFEIDTTIQTLVGSPPAPAPDTQMRMPLVASVFDDPRQRAAVIDWGDGTVEVFQALGNEFQVLPEHTYAEPGVYVVTMGPTKDPEQTFAIDTADAAYMMGGYEKRITKILNWGRNNAPDKLRFRGCSNMDVIADDVPDLSAVTSLSGMFEGCTSLVGNERFSSWNISAITDLSGMFRETNFNQDISTWDTSLVTNMASMFMQNPSFNQPLDSWDTSNVTTMSGMFSQASAFNQPLDSWDTSSVTNITGMFHGASSFNQSVNSWDTSSVTTMTGTLPLAPLQFPVTVGVFTNASSFNQDLDNWDVSAVADWSNTFRGASSFNGNVSTWNTSSVTSISRMFEGASSFNSNISAWNTGGITNMSELFRDAAAFNQDIGSWNTSNVTNMNNMFRDATTFNQQLGGWCVQQIQSQPTGFDQGASNWLFSRPNWGTDCALLSQTLSVIVTSTTGGNISPQGTFVVDYGRNLVFDFDIEPDEGNVLISLEGCNGGTLIGNTYVTENITANCTITATFNLGFFLDENGVTIRAPFVPVGTTGVVNGITYTKRSKNQITAQNAETTVTSGITELRSLFAGSTTFNANISHWDTSSVTDMREMFFAAAAFNQDISYWDTSSVTNMRLMFEGASSFNQPIGSWDVSNVTDMTNMFRNAASFNQDISSWDISKVTTLEGMFSVGGFIGAPSTSMSFNQPIGVWNTSNVTNMKGLFTNNNSFDQDILDWDTSSVTNMSEMFASSSYKKWYRQSDGKNLGDWDVSNVTDMSQMFRLTPVPPSVGPTSMSNLIEFEKWHTGAVTNMSGMFHDAFFFDLTDLQPPRRSLFNGNGLPSWNTSLVTNMNFMFLNQTGFNQDLSGWCVELIPTEPTNFDTNAISWSLPRPVWGAPC